MEDVSGFPKRHITKELQMSLRNSKDALYPRRSCTTMEYTAGNEDRVANAGTDFLVVKPIEKK